MVNIGITGSIACGKSTVTSYLKEKGYKVIDADKIGHDVLMSNEIKRELILTFGEDILENNEINRIKLGQLVFGNEKNLNLLNNIVHPKIRKIILEKQKLYENDKLVFLDVPLLFEAKFDDLVEKTIVVYLDESLQLKRLMERNSLTKEKAQKRINSQMSSKDKAKLGDYIIDNNKDRDFTYKQLDELLKELTTEVL